MDTIQMAFSGSGPSEVVGEATILGEPVAWERPGQNRTTGTTYTPEATKAAEGRVAWGWRQQVGPMRPDSESGFGVSVLFCSRTWKHRDLDNMMKIILDALTGVVWGNDKQVTEFGRVAVRYGADVARTEITIWRVPAQVNPKAKTPKLKGRTR
jgi:Holliday junction resolvase RusA-like endonuclease